MDFETVYAEHFKTVYRFLLSLCRDAHLAEELAQDTFFRAMRHWKQYEGRCAPDTWLCSIAKNAYFSHCRKQKRIVLGDVEGETPDLVGDALESRERQETLHRALHALREPYREVFMLRVFAQLDYAQLGRLFGRGDSWARVTYYRAKGLIQEEVRRMES